MKNRKKFTALLLAGILAVSPCTAACAKGAEAASGTETAEPDKTVTGGFDKTLAENETGNEDVKTEKAPGEASEGSSDNDSGETPEEEAPDENTGDSENPGSDTENAGTGEEETGGDDAGKDDTGKDDTGKDDTGEDETDAGKDDTGKDDAVEDDAGKDDTGEDETDAGKDETGKDETSESKTGEDESEKEETEKEENKEEKVESEGKLAAAGREQVKKMIAELPRLEEVTTAHAAKINAAWKAFYALSAADQAALDAETGEKTGQSYGRDLESAYWGLKVLDAVDASTTLPEGTYDETTDPALFSDYSKGKSSSSRQRPWSVKQIDVDANGQVTGVITVESDSYTYIRTNGKTYPRTNASGNSEFAGVPIDLNTTFYIAAYSTSMMSEIAFSITTSIEEGGSSGEEEIPLTGISLSKKKLSMTARQVHDALKVTLEPENTTFKGKVNWSSSKPKVASVNEKTGEISALSAGEAVITAKAGDFTASCTVTVSEELEDGTIRLKVANRTAMFKVADAYIKTKKGKTKLYITLTGDGYRDLFLGTYEEAVDTGSDSSKWISGKQRQDNALLTYTDTNGEERSVKASGKWQFVLPISAGTTSLEIQSLSHTHKKDGYWWYPRRITVNTKKKTLVADDYEGTKDLQIKNSAKDLSLASASLTTIGGPHSNGYKVTLNLEFGNSVYSKIYLGTAKKAKKNSKDAISVNGKSTAFVVEQIVGTGNNANLASRLNTSFAMSAYDSAAKKWRTFEVTIKTKKGVLNIKKFGKDSQDHGNDEFQNNGGNDKKDGDEVDPSRLNSNSTTMPGAVNNSTTLADGVYGTGQFRFTYSGGSGRVIVTCQKVEVKGGKAYATITFGRSSQQGGSSSFDAVRANGQVYSGSNTFTIPVELNKNNTIVGRTIAMSAPHWVDYTIFISISEPGKEQAGTDVSENTKKLDTEAPGIMGLEKGSELEVRYTDKVKIFQYADDFYLIEVDTVKDSFREGEAYRKFLEKKKDPGDGSGEEGTGTGAQSADAEEIEEDPGIEMEMMEEEGGSPAPSGESASSQAASLYTNEIVKYLVIPKDQEAPAGLEKDVVLIQQPAEKVYISSEGALSILGELSLLDRIDSIGIEKEKLDQNKYAGIVEAMELPKEEEGHLAWGGTYDDWELRTMLLHKTDLMIESGEILPQKEETLEEDMENYLRLAQRAFQMDAAMFLDRSEEEKDEKAKAEWYKVYGILFNCLDEAQKAYQAVVSK